MVSAFLVGFLALGAVAVALALHRRRMKGGCAFKPVDQAAAEDSVDVPEDVKQHFMFWGGAISGVISAAVTHGLDVLKILQHVGRPPPETLSGFIFGMPMGSFAQGERFAVTLVLNATLQSRLDKWEKKAKNKGFKGGWFISFFLSMVAAGSAEFLSNPPVVIKNYQIANSVPFGTACSDLWHEEGFSRFFSGVSMGVLRKSLANAIVLQTIGPTKNLLSSGVAAFVGDPTQQKVVLGFIAGSITGGLAEILTNHPDQVKTLTQTGMGFWEAFLLASRNPFRGAFWAGLRKGVIRGINWGGLAICMAFFERAYRTHIVLTRRKGAELGLRSSAVGA